MRCDPWENDADRTTRKHVSSIPPPSGPLTEKEIRSIAHTAMAKDNLGAFARLLRR